MNVRCLFPKTKTRLDIEVKWEDERGSKLYGLTNCSGFMYVMNDYIGLLFSRE